MNRRIGSNFPQPVRLSLFEAARPPQSHKSRAFIFSLIRQITAAGLLILLTGAAATACTDEQIDNVLNLMVSSDLRSVDEALASCDRGINEGRSYYLRGILPKYFEVSEEHQRRFIDYLVSAAELGYVPAMAIIGGILIEDDIQSEIGWRYVGAAADAGDDWGALYRARQRLAEDQKILQADENTLREAAADGFNLAFWPLIMSELLGGAGESATTRMQRFALRDRWVALENDIALGALLLDPMAVRLAAAAHQLPTSVFSIFDSTSLEAAERIANWEGIISGEPQPDAEQEITRAEGFLKHIGEAFPVPDEISTLVRVGSAFCDDLPAAPTVLSQYCKLRAVADHVYCGLPSLPGGVVRLSAETWQRGNAYHQCRIMRLDRHLSLNVFFKS